MSSLPYFKENSLPGLRKQLTKVSNSLAQERLDHPVSPPTTTTPSSFLTYPWSSIRSKGSLMINLVKDHGCRLTRNELIEQGRRRTSFVQCPAIAADMCDVVQGPIDILPDDVLLDIFDFIQSEAQPTLGEFKEINAWFTLVHVCRRWRNVVFTSTRRLHLLLVCTDRTPVTKELDIWPALPIVISQTAPEMAGVHNIIAALNHNDRVYGISLHRVSNLVLENILAAMLRPFPALKYLHLALGHNQAGVSEIPDSFLGGSAPHLLSRQLDRVEFRGLSNLLLSASGLVTLSLLDIHHFVSPDRHELQSLQSASSQRPPSLTRIVFPALAHFEFKGFSRYLEDIIAHVDAPILDNLSITLLYHTICTTPRLSPLISCPLNLKAPDNALIVFRYNTVSVKIRSQTSTSGHAALKLDIACNGSDLPLSSLALVCGLSLPPLPTVERLYVIFASYHGLYVQNTRWLDLLYPFTALKKLYLSEELAPVSQGAIKVLPTPHDIFLESQLQEAVPQPFIPRQLFSYHIVRESGASDRPP
jgi:hypothetical protein